MDLGKPDAWPLAPFPAVSYPIEPRSELWLLPFVDLCLLRPGSLCCSSKRSAARAGCCGGFSAGSCGPPGTDDADPTGAGVSSTASPSWASLRGKGLGTYGEVGIRGVGQGCGLCAVRRAVRGRRSLWLVTGLPIFLLARNHLHPIRPTVLHGARCAPSGLPTRIRPTR